MGAISNTSGSGHLSRAFFNYGGGNLLLVGACFPFQLWGVEDVPYPVALAQEYRCLLARASQGTLFFARFEEVKGCKLTCGDYALLQMNHSNRVNSEV